MNIKRIFALILLGLFVLLLLNIFIFHIAFQLSIGIYVFLLVVYFFYTTSSGRNVKPVKKDETDTKGKDGDS